MYSQNSSLRKLKINIEKSTFYKLLVCCAFISIGLILWLFWSIFFPPEIPVFTGTSLQIEEAEKTFISLYRVTKIFSYIANSLVVVLFVVYVTLLRSRIAAGYLFFISWIIVFILIAAVPHVTPNSHENNLQIAMGSTITIGACFILIILIYRVFRLNILRRIQFYEWYKMKKEKKWKH